MSSLASPESLDPEDRFVLLMSPGLNARGVVFAPSDEKLSGDGGDSTSAPESRELCVLVVLAEEMLSWPLAEAPLSPLGLRPVWLRLVS